MLPGSVVEAREDTVKNIQYRTIYSTLNLSCNESFSSEFVPPNFPDKSPCTSLDSLFFMHDSLVFILANVTPDNSLPHPRFALAKRL